jgi:hypothetical protein
VGNTTALTAAVCLLFTASAASATEPLQDRIWYHSRAGTAHHPGTGAIALPPSERLRAMALAESCSARGGPRGVYRYMSGKLWLVGLHRCGGGVGLHEVYADMRTPPVAVWVSGAVVARLGRRLCTATTGLPVMEAEVAMWVKNGVVESIVEKVGDPRTCPRTSVR